ncbi:MAG TPA: peptide chain release factor 2 [Chloroflexota bacterium]|nr:peptide chain release factor 2 [Chloroflexota bacterium]
MQEERERVLALRSRISDILVRLDLPAKEQEVAELEQQSTQPEFWDDNRAAQAVMARIAALHEQTDHWRDLARQVEDLWSLFELAEADGDESLVADIDRQAAELNACVDQREFELFLSGPYDHNNAILAVHAGTGGVDSQDWTQMLLRMYLRWAEDHRYKTEIVDTSEGEEAGIKSATVEITGRDAYGYLKGERGVHRLVRLSPFDQAHRRHTSFALVEVMPEVADEGEIEIDPKDLRVDTYRSTGAGGQHVNKTESAVRITHIPTGIVVTCQNERSQMQNRDVAMRILRSKLVEKRLEEQAEEQAKMKGEYRAADFGNAVRSYVLHPYNMVKDNRSGYETSNANGVLDGDLDGFVQAYLKATIGS